MALEEKMKSGELYNCSPEAMDEALMGRLMEYRELLYEFNTSRPSEGEKREEIIRKLFAEAGENCYLEPPFCAN